MCRRGKDFRCNLTTCLLFFTIHPHIFLLLPLLLLISPCSFYRQLLSSLTLHLPVIRKPTLIFHLPSIFSFSRENIIHIRTADLPSPGYEHLNISVEYEHVGIWGSKIHTIIHNLPSLHRTAPCLLVHPQPIFLLRHHLLGIVVLSFVHSFFLSSFPLSFFSLFLPLFPSSLPLYPILFLCLLNVLICSSDRRAASADVITGWLIIALYWLQF